MTRSLAETLPEQRIEARTTALWPECDPLFPPEWGDRLGEWFSDVTMSVLGGVGHFAPVEAPATFAAAILDATSR